MKLVNGDAPPGVSEAAVVGGVPNAGLVKEKDPEEPGTRGLDPNPANVPGTELLWVTGTLLGLAVLSPINDKEPAEAELDTVGAVKENLPGGWSMP